MAQKLFGTPNEEVPEVDALIARLDGGTETASAGEALVAAARLMEYAAFEVALTEAPRPVGQLIQLAAELSRIANDMTSIEHDHVRALRTTAHLT